MLRYKKVVVYSGVNNPKDFDGNTPETVALMHQHYAMVRLLSKFKDENTNLDWNSIAYNAISPFEEIPLQKMAFLNNGGAVRAFIEKEDNDTILKEYSKVNQMFS